MAVFHPSDFFGIAENLFENNKTPAGYRTVIGRAYYAAFLSARDQAGISSKEKDGHSRVINHYLSIDPNNPKFATIGNQLNTLRTQRTAADYECHENIESRDAGKALSTSRRITESLNALKTESTQR